MLKGSNAILKIISSFAFILFFTGANATTQKTDKTYLPINKDVKQFITEMVKQYQFDQKKLTAILQKAHYLPNVIQSMERPLEKKPWDFYRRFFVRDKYIKPGITYRQKHQQQLDMVYKKYGVDRNIIVAIIGVESFYGTHAGGYQEIGALSTLAFHYPKRQQFFRKELKHYLLLARENKLPVLELKGSYAGALGIPQFMPSSYRHYGVEFNAQLKKSKQVNLLDNHADAMASIGNYLKRSGWQRNQPIAVRAYVRGKIPNKIISNNGKPKYTIAQLAKYGVRPAIKIAPKRRVALMKFTSPGSTEYWIVFKNFYAIMQYNRSPLYALAVTELSKKIKHGYQQTQTSSGSTSARQAR